IKVVVDADDDLHSVHSLKRAFDAVNELPGADFKWFRECCKRADLVTVSTPALAQRYGSHGRVAVLRNCVDDSWLDIRNRGDGRTVGWAGALSNHPTDLQVTHGGVAAAVKDVDARFMCVGGEARQDEVAKALGFDSIEATHWVPLELHPHLVSQLDVGI